MNIQLYAQQIINLQCYKTHLMLILIFLLLPLAAPYSLTPPPHCESAFDTLYNNNANELNANTVTIFSITYTGTYSKANLIFGISGYKGTDFLRNQSFSLVASDQTHTGYNMIVSLGGNTHITHLAIRYMVMEYADDFFAGSLYVDNLLTNVSVNSTSTRTETILYQLPAEQKMKVSSSRVYTFLTGIGLRSYTGFSITHSSSLHNQSIISIVVTAERQSYLDFIALTYLVVNSQAFAPSYILNTFKTALDQTGSATQQWDVFGSSTPLFVISTARFVMGMTGLHNSVSTKILVFQSSFATSTSLQITNPNNIEQINFVILVYAKITCLGQFWNPSTTSCVSQCDSDQTSSPEEGYCEICSNSCKKCSKKPTFCTQCSVQSFLIEQAGLCSPQKFNMNILAILGVIPIIITILVIYLVRKGRKRKLINNNIVEHPSIQL